MTRWWMCAGHSITHSAADHYFGRCSLANADEPSSVSAVRTLQSKWSTITARHDSTTPNRDGGTVCIIFKNRVRKLGCDCCEYCEYFE
jgi:hypothetical protein